MSTLAIETRADRNGDPVPVRFGPPGGRCEEVECVLDRWVGEDHRYFRVRVHDGSEYILRHDLAADAWRVHSFRSGAAGVEGFAASHATRASSRGATND